VRKQFSHSFKLECFKLYIDTNNINEVARQKDVSKNTLLRWKNEGKWDKLKDEIQAQRMEALVDELKNPQASEA
jgi:transposase-like protein